MSEHTSPFLSLMQHRTLPPWHYALIGGVIGAAVGIVVMIVSFITENVLIMMLLAFPLFWGLMHSMERTMPPALSILSGVAATLALYAAIGVCIALLATAKRRARTS